jgi:serine/threonine protein phosphatase PrpC
MNDRTDLSYFNLNGIDRSIGYEKFRSSPVDSIVKITLAIEPHAELKLTSPVEVTLHVHLRYHLDGSITVTTTDRNALRYIPEDKVRRDGDVHQILIPGIDRVKYPLTVWLYAIRDLFSLPKEREWGSATFLADEFKHILADWPSYTPTTAAQLRLYTGAGRTRGKRNYMEDVDLVFESINITNKRSISVFGVLDGHGGKECAQYCADDIPMRVATLLRNGSSCPEALYKAFRESDLECLETAACGNAGSTANIAVYDASVNVFFIANTGDTRAVLSRGSKALDLSYDRKGSDPEEIARVVRAGGFVNKGRIMGTLAVSRALGTHLCCLITFPHDAVFTLMSAVDIFHEMFDHTGDMQLKEQGSQGLKRVLIPDPELSCFYPTQADEFLLIATDGLWDVMTSQAAVDFARNLLTQEGLLGEQDQYLVCCVRTLEVLPR